MCFGVTYCCHKSKVYQYDIYFRNDNILIRHCSYADLTMRNLGNLFEYSEE